jgi:hypothetical protein
MCDSAPGLAASPSGNGRRVAGLTNKAFNTFVKLGLSADFELRPSGFGFSLGVRSLLGQGGLGVFHQFLHPLGIRLGMAVTAHWIGAARRFDQNIRPDHAGFDVDGGDLADGDAHLILAEPGTFASGNGFIADLDNGRKEQIALRPPTGTEDFCWHTESPNVSPGGMLNPALCDPDREVAYDLPTRILREHDLKSKVRQDRLNDSTEAERS